MCRSLRRSLSRSRRGPGGGEGAWKERWACAGGLPVGGGHSGLALTVKRIDKLREGTADTRTGKAEDLREDGGPGMQENR